MKEDYEGEELGDLAAAKEIAMGSAREIIADRLLAGAALLTGCSFEICDEAGALLFAFPFSEAAAKPGSPP